MDPSTPPLQNGGFLSPLRVGIALSRDRKLAAFYTRWNLETEEDSGLLSLDFSNVFNPLSRTVIVGRKSSRKHYRLYRPSTMHPHKRSRLAQIGTTLYLRGRSTTE